MYTATATAACFRLVTKHLAGQTLVLASFGVCLLLQQRVRLSAAVETLELLVVLLEGSTSQQSLQDLMWDKKYSNVSHRCARDSLNY